MKSCRNPCIVGAMPAYLEELALPAPGQQLQARAAVLVVVDEVLLRPQ